MLIPHSHKTTRKKILIVISVSVFIGLLILSNLLPKINAADDYILNSGTVGGTPWNNDLIFLEAGHNYYFTFKATESILITAFTVNIWAYNNTQSECDSIQGNFCIFHIDFSIYEGSGSIEVSPSNILMKTWEYSLSRENATFYSWELKTSVTDENYYSTKSNAYIAVAFSPSIDITVNGTTNTGFTQYEDNTNNDMIVYLTSSLQGERIGFYAVWNLLKGAESKEIAYPVAVSIYEPRTMVETFATVSGFSFTAVGIAVFSFMLLSLTILLYKKGVEITPVIFGISTLGLLSIFGYLQITPFWFYLPVGMLSLTLIGYSEAAQIAQSFEK